VTRPAKAGAKAAELPAAYAASDLLAVGGVDVRTERWTVRRKRLEQLAAAWTPPLQLTPVTSDRDEAREWLEVLPAAMGVEGLVVKGAATRYTPGRRDAWVKVNSVGVAVFDELPSGRYGQVSNGSVELDCERRLSDTAADDSLLHAARLGCGSLRWRRVRARGARRALSGSVVGALTHAAPTAGTARCPDGHGVMLRSSRLASGIRQAAM
jgi:ATP dependent DNA ligase domain